MSADDLPAKNTDRELYREPKGDLPSDYYANSVHVTEHGSIGMNVGGHVIVLPIAEWHRRAADPPAARPVVDAPRGFSEFIAAWMAHPAYPVNLGGAAFLAEKLAEHGWVQDAADVRRGVAEEIAAAIEAEKAEHLADLRADLTRETRGIVGSAYNAAHRIAREAGSA